MLIDRVRPASTTGTIYHYCSAQTFLSIIQNKTIRFTDLNLLNDGQEGVWGYSVFIEAANRLLERREIPDKMPLIPLEFIDKIDELWHFSGFRLAHFVACFSSDGDSLSQWRAYADDGRGFAIGFKASELRKLPIQILDVLYDRDKQVMEMLMAIGAMYYEFQQKEQDYDKPWFFERRMQLAASAVALKNPAWQDEKEVRCQHVADVAIRENEAWTMSDGGGISGDQEVDGQPIQFQVRDSVIVPFFDMPFAANGESQPLDEIVFGPKCLSGEGNVRFLLGNCGYGSNIKLRSAGAAYR